MVDLGQKKVDLSAFFYAPNLRGGEHSFIDPILTICSANRFPSSHDLPAFFYAPNPRGGFENEIEIETEIDVEMKLEIK